MRAGIMSLSEDCASGDTIRIDHVPVVRAYSKDCEASRQQRRGLAPFTARDCRGRRMVPVPKAAKVFFRSLDRLVIHIFFVCISFLSLLLFPAQAAADEIEFFAGSASKPATEELVKAFETETGHSLTIHFGSSGNLLSQMKIAQRGDLYFPGSPDYMKKAIDDGVVRPETIRIVTYLVPAINVQKGNPKQIHSLNDLSGEGVRVAIGNPHHVCVGLYAVEILEHAGLADAVRPNIRGYTESCAKTANLVAMKGVDAVIGWRVFQYWNPDQIETVMLSPEQVVRISYMPIAISSFCKNPAPVQEFIDFACSDKGKSIFEKWGYITREDEARKLAPRASIGGEYALLDKW